MEELAALFHGFSVVLTPFNLTLMFIGITLGSPVGFRHLQHLYGRFVKKYRGFEH